MYHLFGSSPYTKNEDHWGVYVDSFSNLIATQKNIMKQSRFSDYSIVREQPGPITKLTKLDVTTNPFLLRLKDGGWGTAFGGEDVTLVDLKEVLGYEIIWQTTLVNEHLGISMLYSPIRFMRENTILHLYINNDYTVFGIVDIDRTYKELTDFEIGKE